MRDDATCFWSVNVCMHVFRQSRAVLRIVTLHALPLPHPHSRLPLDFIPSPNVCCAPFSVPPPSCPSSLPSSCLSHAVLQLAGDSSPHSSSTSICFSQQLSCFKGRQGHSFCATLLCPSGLLSSHVLFILQVTTLCRWSISTSRGSWATTSYRLTSLL